MASRKSVVMSTQPGSFLTYLCASYPRILVFHLLLWAGLALNTLVLLFADLTSAATVVTYLNYVGLVVFLLGSGAVLVVCRRQ